MRRRWLMRFIWLDLGLVLALTLWFFFNSSPQWSFVCGFLFAAIGTAVFEEWHKAHLRLPEVRTRILQTRVANIDEKMETLHSERQKLERTLELLVDDPRFSFSPHNKAAERKLIDQIEKLAKEIAPKREKRAKLQAELDALEQKKGYRGSR